MVENIKEQIKNSSFISFTGFATTGKDEATKIIETLGFKRVSLADPVRQGIYNINPIIGLDAKSAYELLSEFSSQNIIDVASDLTFIRLQNVVDFIGWDEAKKIPEVRRLLQYYGTEGGRDIFGETIWTDVADRHIKENQIEKVVISDLRFPNELDWVRSKKDNLVVKIIRKGVGSINNHSSDVGIKDELCDIIIRNNGTLEELRNQLI